jgi:hypothetical protein
MKKPAGGLSYDNATKVFKGYTTRVAKEEIRLLDYKSGQRGYSITGCNQGA